MFRVVHGVAINDADYSVRRMVNGKDFWCPFYRAWRNILKRCYCKAFQDKYPLYIGCSVCEEWLTFSNFKRWMEQQDWQGKQLDKDFLLTGNKVYSPETCVFIDGLTNSFILDCAASRGKYPLGVDFHKSGGKLRSRCCNPFTKKSEHLGLFTCPNEAHEAWRKRKHELACQLADLQDDPRVAAALRTRYL